MLTMLTMYPLILNHKFIFADDLKIAKVIVKFKHNKIMLKSKKNFLLMVYAYTNPKSMYICKNIYYGRNRPQAIVSIYNKSLTVALIKVAFIKKAKTC